MASPHTPRSLEMERQWLSMMQDNRDDDVAGDPFIEFDRKVYTPTSRSSSSAGRRRRKPRLSNTAPPLRPSVAVETEIPVLTPKGRRRGGGGGGGGGQQTPTSTNSMRTVPPPPVLTKSRSWWSFASAAQSENPSDELEAASAGGGSDACLPASPDHHHHQHHHRGRKVRFDKSVKKVTNSNKKAEAATAAAAAAAAAVDTNNGNSCMPSTPIRASSSKGTGSSLNCGAAGSAVETNTTKDSNTKDNNDGNGNNSTNSRFYQQITKSESMLDLIQDRLCNYDASAALYKWEEQMEKKMLLNNPVFRNFIEPADSNPFSDDDEEEDEYLDLEEEEEFDYDGRSDISEPFSPVSSQSFDEIFSADPDIDYKQQQQQQQQQQQEDAQSDGLSTASKYKDMLKRARVAQKVKELINHQKPATKGGARSNSNSKPWEPTTDSIGRLKLQKDQNPNFTPAQEAAVEVSPFQRLSKIPSGGGESSPPPLGEKIRTRSTLESKFKMLTTMHDPNDQNAAAEEEEEEDEEELEEDDASEDDISAKENGILSSRFFGLGRGLGRSRSRSRGRSQSRGRDAGNGTPKVAAVATEAAPPPQKKTTEYAAAAWVALPSTFDEERGVSTDENGTIRRRKNSPLTILPEETQSKVCTLPVLQQRLMNMRGSSRTPATSLAAKSGPGISMGQNTSFSSGSPQRIPKDLTLYDYSSARQAYVAYFHRGPVKATKSIRLYEHPIPPSFPMLDFEVVVKVEYSTVTETDCAVRKGIFWGDGTQNPLNLPIVPGAAFSGTVLQIDKSSSRSGLKGGDTVTSLVRVGANSRHLCIGYDRLVKVPDTLRETAAVTCLPEVYLSAFQALHIDQRGSVRYRKHALSGKAILILGGTAKLGRALVELSLAAGSGTVYATAREKSFGMVEDVGGIPLDRDPHHWYSLLAGKMDLVICVDAYDKARSELKYEHTQTLNKHGRLVLMDGPEDECGKVVELHKFDEQSVGTARKLHHYNVFHSWETDMKQGKRDLSHLLKLLAEDAIRPKIFERVPLTKVPRAQQVIDKTPMSGFILCEPWLKCDKSKDRSISNSDASSWSNSLQS